MSGATRTKGRSVLRQIKELVWIMIMLLIFAIDIMYNMFKFGIMLILATE